MVRPIGQIQRDLDRLEQSVQSLAAELSKSYHEYLSALGHAVRRQLIMAGYHICTQGYPEQFLRLSTNQRYQIQQDLREAASQAQDHLTSLPAKLEAAARQLQMKRTEADASVPSSADLEQPQDSLEQSDLETDLEADLPERPQISLEFSNSTPEVMGAPLSADNLEVERETDVKNLETYEPDPQGQSAAEEGANPDATTAFFDRLKRPAVLLQWQQGLEAGIGEVLRMASRKTNHLFQSCSIMPRQFPESMLEAASKSDAVEGGVAGVPNILNLVIEPVELSIPDSDETEDETNGITTEQREALREAVRSLPPLRITAVNLRLSEVEFANPQVMTYRSKIRELLLRLKNLERSYQKCHHERAIAEAEAAWRASWVDE